MLRHSVSRFDGVEVATEVAEAWDSEGAGVAGQAGGHTGLMVVGTGSEEDTEEVKEEENSQTLITG